MKIETEYLYILSEYDDTTFNDNIGFNCILYLGNSETIARYAYFNGKNPLWRLEISSEDGNRPLKRKFLITLQ